MLGGTDNILQNIPHIQYALQNIMYNIVSPTKHLCESR